MGRAAGPRLDEGSDSQSYNGIITGTNVSIQAPRLCIQMRFLVLLTIRTYSSAVEDSTLVTTYIFHHLDAKKGIAALEKVINDLGSQQTKAGHNSTFL